MISMHGSVGAGGLNTQEDVEQVQILLNRHIQWLDISVVEITGHADPLTIGAIRSFQKNACALLTYDGLVAPFGFVWKRLNEAVIPKPKHAIFDAMCWYHPRTGLQDADYTAAAQTLKCEKIAIQAVAATETKRTAWDTEGRPAILFERHYFYRLSGKRYDKTHPDISNPKSGGYGLYRAQYPKLHRAAVLNETAALQSASWGTFQIMGANYAACGFETVDAFVTAMLDREIKHLNAFVSLISSNNGMSKALCDKDWATFARLYNGPDYADNDYDTNMADAYKRLQGPTR